MRTEVRPLSPSLEPDFLRVLSSNECAEEGEDWCHCVAWWVPSWDGWGERTAGQNAALRADLFSRGEHDGFLLYADGEPARWCQAGLRDRLPKLTGAYDLPQDGGAWAVSCFVLRPGFRGRGLAHALLAGVLDALRARGVRHVQGFPRRGEHDAGGVWTGPEALFVRAGFTVEHEAARGPVYGLRFM